MPSSRARQSLHNAVMNLFNRIFKLSCIFLSTGFGLATLQADPLSPDQRKMILEQLKEIEEVVEGKRISTRTSAVEMFRAAATSDKAAYDFYLKCVKLLRFDDKNSSFTDYRNWRERNEEALKEESNLLAMRLQLQYLVLTLRVAEGVSRDTIIPELETFLSNIVSHTEDLEGKGWQTLREPVNRTVFAEAFELNQSLQVPDWSFSPGKFSECYDKTVFPYIRAENPSEIGAAWDRRIQLEKQYVAIVEEDDEVALEKFQTERLPRFYWQKATDVFLHASESTGARSLMELIRQNSDHPDATKWLKSFKALLAGDTPGEG